MNKTSIQSKLLRDTKIICEECSYSIDCSILEPCPDYCPDIGSNFEAIVSFKRTLTPSIIETNSLKDY